MKQLEFKVVVETSKDTDYGQDVVIRAKTENAGVGEVVAYMELSIAKEDLTGILEKGEVYKVSFTKD